jgi:hypothetical protein
VVLVSLGALSERQPRGYTRAPFLEIPLIPSSANLPTHQQFFVVEAWLRPISALDVTSILRKVSLIEERFIKLDSCTASTCIVKFFG